MLNAREVENIVDHLEQVSGDSVANAPYSACSCVISVDSSSCSIPNTPFMGVRSSWLIMARKSDLVRLASADCSRAWINRVIYSARLFFAGGGKAMGEVIDASRANLQFAFANFRQGAGNYRRVSR
jgi:hypothetical protein